MRCELCGRRIHAGEHSLSTTIEEDGAPIGNRAYPIHGTRTKPVVLCDVCAANRNSSYRWFLWAIPLMIGGLVLAAYLVGLLVR